MALLERCEFINILAGVGSEAKFLRGRSELLLARKRFPRVYVHFDQEWFSANQVLGFTFV